MKAGRLKEQRAVLAHTAADGRKVSAHAVRRSYHYDKDGNLVRSDDQRSGSTQYRYDALGQTVSAAGRSYAYDPAHNILDHIEADGAAAAAVAEIIGRPANDNRVRHHNGHSYYYDDFGNVIQKEKADGEVHNYHYDPLHQLVQADIFRPGREKESWTYQYDAVGRRIRKRRIDAEGGILGETRYLWSGDRLLQTIDGWQTHTYLYAGQDGYEPLAQVRNWTDAEHGSHESIHYFHCDQIGRPRELTDAEGRLLWYGEYDALGRLEREEDICGVSQPFRLQNQHYDEETGLHYNLLRYYDADMGRFLTQDPIGLSGGENAYTYAPNVQMWIDPLGLAKNKFAFDHVDCVARRKKINNIENDIQKRNLEIRTNPGNLPYKHLLGMKPRDSVEGHIKIVEQLENTLKNHKKWLSDNCEDPPPPASQADSKCIGKCAENKDGNSNSLGMIAGGVGVGYLIYRGVRMIPSFFPALWWTIPVNAVTP